MDIEDIQDRDHPYIRIPIDEEAIEGNPQLIRSNPSESLAETSDKYVVSRYKAQFEYSGAIPIDEISEVTDTERKAEMEDLIYKYHAKDQRFVPLLFDGEYFDIKEDDFYELPPEMLISPVTALIEGLTLLTEYPFLICDGFGDMEFYIYDKDNITMSPEELATNVDDEGREETIESPYELRQRYPSVEEDLIPESPDRFRIITISDINKKRTKDALFPYFGQFAGVLADLIKDEYPDSESLSSAVEGRALNNWQENKGTETEVHISEFLGLYHMESIISNSNKLLSDCGFQ